MTIDVEKLQALVEKMRIEAVRTHPQCIVNTMVFSSLLTKPMNEVAQKFGIESAYNMRADGVRVEFSWTLPVHIVSVLAHYPAEAVRKSKQRRATRVFLMDLDGNLVAG